ERMSYRADVASNGLEALAALKRQPYDLVLMDVQMPEMDGLEAARQIQKLFPEEARPRIVALTANAMKEDREACREAGMADYRGKPVRVAELRAALDRTGKAMQSASLPPATAPAEDVPPAPAAQAEILDSKMLASLREISTRTGANVIGDLLGLFRADGPP